MMCDQYYEFEEPSIRTVEVEHDFVYKDLSCIITLSCFGWRSAYIVLPKGYKYFNRNSNTLSFIDCHGGINYAQATHPCIYTGNDSWIIGWDYNHQGDAYDFTAVDQLFGEGTINAVKNSYYMSNANMMYHGNNCRKYTVDDIEQEIKQVIDKYL